ncbi:sulfoquinovosidase-like [Hibiscus syriacus]|uniref:sulfoquinovosidase-like n=1 Tax=Hibiscus syriacus TaxID=106335 RepID=UPI0019227046|nr:sulfoquinovosidase-like [Hibiscus syriacus]
MSTFKITKKHHKHLNNPFPSTPRSIPFIQGNLFTTSQTLPPNQSFQVGKDFQLLWSTENGGCLSISHLSQPSKSLWSTIPGEAFISAAVAETEVEESRGSFAIKSRYIQLVCHHQSIEDIIFINRFFDEHHGFLPDYLDLDHLERNPKFADCPVLVITGHIFSRRKMKGPRSCIKSEAKISSASARYWVLFDQKENNQIGFQVKIGQPKFQLHRHKASPSTASESYRRLRRKLRRRRKWNVGWCWFLSRKKGLTANSSSEEELGESNVAETITEFNRVCLTYASEENEIFFGFGEQFSHMNFKGRRVPIFVQEQGIGRGDQPITFAANLVSYRAGGDWSTTYAPSPFYMTSKMRSLYLEGYNYSIFDLTRYDRVQVQIHGKAMQGRILHGNSPLEIIEHFTETIGRPPELPEWVISGAVVGMQGGTETVRSVWDKLKTYKVPISAFWLQDWVGQRETLIGSQLWWNWEVDVTRYPEWQQLVKDLGTNYIKVMTYCNPCLALVDEKPNKRRNLFEEAKELDILVKDKHGELYMVPNTAFDVGMLDLTHPLTASWFKQILQEMVVDGVRGWMADFGEGLPVDAVLYSGEDPISAHNKYPELWAQINREFVEEWKNNHAGKEREDLGDLVFFMRAGFRDSPRWGMLFWEGDQMVSWQVNDGIKSSVVALLSSGLSGFAFNHSDIGGYCTINLPVIKYCRSEELLLRWMELNAFTIVFRTHEGNKPRCNSQFYSNEKTLSHFARFAKVYKAWKFYRVQLVKEAAQKGLPVCRHLFLHYPDDERVQSLSYQQFLVGSEILVVPVLYKGKKNVKAYFPVGETCAWKHIWTGKLYQKHGSEARIEAPFGYPAVFVKVGSTVGETFLTNLRNLEIL